MDIANKKLLKKTRMESDVLLKTGIEQLSDFLRYDENIKIIEDRRMFEDYRKEYSKPKRFGMWMSDKMDFMSLAHIMIN